MNYINYRTIMFACSWKLDANVKNLLEANFWQGVLSLKNALLRNLDDGKGDQLTVLVRTTEWKVRSVYSHTDKGGLSTDRVSVSHNRLLAHNVKVPGLIHFSGLGTILGIVQNYHKRLLNSMFLIKGHG